MSLVMLLRHHSIAWIRCADSCAVCCPASEGSNIKFRSFEIHLLWRKAGLLVDDAKIGGEEAAVGIVMRFGGLCDEAS